jgi:hypothetical protein
MTNTLNAKILKRIPLALVPVAIVLAACSRTVKAPVADATAISPDPTGTYHLDSKTENKDGEVYGYTGVIQVKRLVENRIVMTFGVCKGAPSYNSGSFVDTLHYANNRAVFTAAEFDPSCRITFDLPGRESP